MVVEFPMVEEDVATGRVAAVYAAASAHAPFVPSLLKSPAVCPHYLVLAWEQVEPVLDDPALSEGASRLAAEERWTATPPPDPGDRDVLGGFVAPIGKMLLVSCGLLAALDGRLAERPGAVGAAPAAPGRFPQRSVPSLRELPENAAVIGRIRAALGTPIVNSVWRKAAAEGRLERLWDELEPQVPLACGAADRLRERAMTSALQLPWRTAAGRVALETAGIADAEPAMRVILDAYGVTLARVLSLIASSVGDTK